MSVRFGIIGCSRVARRRFLPALISSPLATLTFVGSRDSNKARQYAEEFHSHKSGSYEDVLADEEVDAVYISTPPLSHFEWVLKAARAGKHIICEKPAFPDYKTALEAVSVCREMGLHLIENYAFKYHPQHRAVAELVQKGDIGKIKDIEGVFTYPRPPEGDIRLNPQLGGGIFHDSAGYPIVAALFHAGAPLSIKADLAGDSGIDVSFNAELSFPGGVRAHAKVAFSETYQSIYTITGTKGSLQVKRAYAVNPDFETEIVFESAGRLKTVHVAPADQFRLLIEDVCQALKAGNSGDFEEKLLMQAKVMDAALASYKEQREVNVIE